MSFFANMKDRRAVQPEGLTSSSIAIVGDYSDNFDMKGLRPFIGSAGTVLEQCLHAAGLIRGGCYITNAEKTGKPLSSFWFENSNKTKKYLLPEGQDLAQELYAELEATDANVIVACGDAVFNMLTGVTGVNKFRGYFFNCPYIAGGRKVLPIYHPRDAVFTNYLRRHVISTDLRKARSESLTRSLLVPERQLVYNFENVGEVLDWLNYYEQQDIVSCDIEVLNFAISLISFSSSPEVGIAIPLTSKWSVDDELLILRGIQRVLGNPRIKKVYQNGIFDLQFKLAQNGLVVRGEILDTMIAHSVVYPELPKGLGFLGSIYCGTQPYWKDRVNFDNIKEEA